MPPVYLKEFIYYVDPRGRRCHACYPGAQQASESSKVYYGQVRDAADRWCEVPLCTDMRASQLELLRFVLAYARIILNRRRAARRRRLSDS